MSKAFKIKKEEQFISSSQPADFLNSIPEVGNKTKQNNKTPVSQQPKMKTLTSFLLFMQRWPQDTHPSTERPGAARLPLEEVRRERRPTLLLFL